MIIHAFNPGDNKSDVKIRINAPEIFKAYYTNPDEKRMYKAQIDASGAVRATVDPKKIITLEFEYKN